MKSPELFRTFYPRGGGPRGGGGGGTLGHSNLDLRRHGTAGQQDYLIAITSPSNPTTSHAVQGCHPLEPQVLRGGCARGPSNKTASMLELHQRLLEESLNCSDHVLDRRKAAALEMSAGPSSAQ